MVGGTYLRLLTALVLFVAEAAPVMMFLALAPGPSRAQFFEDRFPFQNRRQRGLFDWFGPGPQPPPHQPERAPPERAPPADYSKAPVLKTDSKAENAATVRILVLGDSMADWLAYGLELTYADSPEIGILRRHRTNSGLIRTEVRSDSRGEYPDWPQAARELIAAQKPNFVLMMVGINDRRQFRETGQVAQAARAAEDPAASELYRSAQDKPNETSGTVAAEPATPVGNRSFEFRTDAWSAAYMRRIDDTIAALKTSKVPVFWVGLPPVRGQKSAGDIPFLNDLYRRRAEKAGIIYIDVWDGFVDEDGRYAQHGPDVQGQTRKLRTSDGAYFTQAGARKLAHYVEREVQRWLSTRAAPVAVAIPEESKGDTAAGPGPSGRRARPLAGPVVPLIAERGSETDHLLGGDDRQRTSDALVAKALVRGEAVTAPAGRADDFVWPRRGIAPVGSDPVVATTDLPMTPMVAEGNATTSTTGAATPSRKVATAAAQLAKPAAHHRVTPRPLPHAYAQYRPDYRQPPAQGLFNFQFLFGTRW
jgi:hypothetical protein